MTEEPRTEAPDDQAKACDPGERAARCEHVCMKDEHHVERGEPHYYCYELPVRRSRELDEARAEIDALRSELEAMRPLPAESMALTVALAQMLRGDTPTPNVSTVVMWAAARMAGMATFDPDLGYVPAARSVRNGE